MPSIRRGIGYVGLSLSRTGLWVRDMIESESMDGKERESIIPLKRLANSVGSSLFEGNDRDLAVDKELSEAEKRVPAVLQFISFKGSKK